MILVFISILKMNKVVISTLEMNITAIFLKPIGRNKQP